MDFDSLLETQRQHHARFTLGNLQMSTMKRVAPNPNITRRTKFTIIRMVDESIGCFSSQSHYQSHSTSLSGEINARI